MRVVRLVAGAICTIAVVAAAPLAAQEAKTVRFVYVRGEGAEACPDEQTLRGQVRAMLGRQPFHENANETLTATLARAENAEVSGVGARIEVRDRAGKLLGERHIEPQGGECADLASAAALAIAIAIDPLASMRAPLPSGPPPPGSASTVAPGNIAQVNRRAEATPRGRIKYQVAAGVLAAVGSTPDTSLAVRVMGGRRLTRRSPELSLNLDVRVDVPTSIDVAQGDVSAWMGLASLLPCVHGGLVLGCAIVGGGVLRSRGENLGNASAATTPVAVAGARAALELPLTNGVLIQGHVDVLGMLWESRLVVGENEVWRTPRVATAFGLAYLTVFP